MHRRRVLLVTVVVMVFRFMVVTGKEEDHNDKPNDLEKSEGGRVKPLLSTSSSASITRINHPAHVPWKEEDNKPQSSSLQFQDENDSSGEDSSLPLAYPDTLLDEQDDHGRLSNDLSPSGGFNHQFRRNHILSKRHISKFRGTPRVKRQVVRVIDTNTVPANPYEKFYLCLFTLWTNPNCRQNANVHVAEETPNADIAVEEKVVVPEKVGESSLTSQISPFSTTNYNPHRNGINSILGGFNGGHNRPQQQQYNWANGLFGGRFGLNPPGTFHTPASNVGVGGGNYFNHMSPFLGFGQSFQRPTHSNHNSQYYPFNNFHHQAVIPFPEQQVNRRPGPTAPSRLTTPTTTTSTTSSSTSTTSKLPSTSPTNSFEHLSSFITPENVEQEESSTSASTPPASTTTTTTTTSSVTSTTVVTTKEPPVVSSLTPSEARGPTAITIPIISPSTPSPPSSPSPSSSSPSVVKALLSENTGLKSDLSKLQKEVSTYQVQNKFLQDALGTLQTEGERSRSRTGQLEETIDHLQQKNGQLQHSLQDQRVQLNEMSSRVKYAEDKMVKLARQGIEDQKALGRSRNRIRDLERETSECKQELYQLQFKQVRLPAKKPPAQVLIDKQDEEEKNAYRDDHPSTRSSAEVGGSSSEVVTTTLGSVNDDEGTTTPLILDDEGEGQTTTSPSLDILLNDASFVAGNTTTSHPPISSTEPTPTKNVTTVVNIPSTAFVLPTKSAPSNSQNPSFLHFHFPHSHSNSDGGPIAIASDDANEDEDDTVSIVGLANPHHSHHHAFALNDDGDLDASNANDDEEQLIFGTLQPTFHRGYNVFSFGEHGNVEKVDGDDDEDNVRYLVAPVQFVSPEDVGSGTPSVSFSRSQAPPLPSSNSNSDSNTNLWHGFAPFPIYSRSTTNLQSSDRRRSNSRATVL